MSTMSLGQKAQRTLQFLLALRVAAIAGALAKFGFDAEDLAKGWQLLSALTRGRLDGAAAPVDASLVDRIDAWENVWFPVADATLASNAPEAHAFVFHNLSQTSGPAVIVSVGTLVQRIEKLESAVSRGGLGGPGHAARQLLVKRGLTDDVLGDVKTLLETVTMPEDVAEPDIDTDASDEAERALWAWYLEWSAIARVAIKDRRLLRRCGFLKSDKSAPDETPPAKPVTALPATATQATPQS